MSIDDWTDCNQYIIQQTSEIEKNKLFYTNTSYDNFKNFILLKYIVENNEISIRSFNLCFEICSKFPSNYSAWIIRRKYIKSIMNNDLKTKLLLDELKLVRELIKKHLKCYQLWRHRLFIIEALNDESSELNDLNESLELDQKNINTWTHRTRIIEYFYKDNLEMFNNELLFISRCINQDCRNNSYWGYRYYIIVNKTRILRETKVKEDGEMNTKDTIMNEIEYVLYWLDHTPHNPSLWNYLRALFNNPHINDRKSFRYRNPDLLDLKDIPKILLESLNQIYLSHSDTCFELVYFMACIAFNNKEYNKVVEYIEKLVKIDPIRSHYWQWKLTSFVQMNDFK